MPDTPYTPLGLFVLSLMLQFLRSIPPCFRLQEHGSDMDSFMEPYQYRTPSYKHSHAPTPHILTWARLPSPSLILTYYSPPSLTSLTLTHSCSGPTTKCVLQRSFLSAPPRLCLYPGAFIASITYTISTGPEYHFPQSILLIPVIYICTVLVQSPDLGCSPSGIVHLLVNACKPHSLTFHRSTEPSFSAAVTFRGTEKPVRHKVRLPR